MDKRKLKLLKFLLNNCNDGYKVVETNTIYKLIKKYKNNFEYLQEDIKYLKQRKYIDVKYVDKDNICLSVMDNTRIFQENLKVERESKKEMYFMMIITMIVSGVMAFLGAFLAIIIRG